MAITLTDNDISTRYALQEDFNNGFLGRDRQIVIKTDDPKGYRPIIMDGVTSGGKNKVALVEDLTDYLTKTEGGSTYATKTELSSGLGAKLDTSTANSTFATKTEVTQGLAAKLDSATAASTYATKAQVPTITTGTEDLTAGSSSLATGAYHFVYE
jgi:hypothetical protein